MSAQQSQLDEQEEAPHRHPVNATPSRDNNQVPSLLLNLLGKGGGGGEKKEEGEEAGEEEGEVSFALLQFCPLFLGV